MTCNLTGISLVFAHKPSKYQVNSPERTKVPVPFLYCVRQLLHQTPAAALKQSAIPQHRAIQTILRKLLNCAFPLSPTYLPLYESLHHTPKFRNLASEADPVTTPFLHSFKPYPQTLISSTSPPNPPCSPALSSPSFSVSRLSSRCRSPPTRPRLTTDDIFSIVEDNDK